MNVLITGVAGLIGANLADWITANQKDVKVVGVDDLSGGYLDNINREVVFHKLNLVSDNIEYIFEHFKFDIVFHF